MAKQEPMKFKGKEVLRCGAVLPSHRIYPREVMVRAVQDEGLQQRIREGKVFGSDGVFPPQELGDLHRYCFVVEKVYMDGDRVMVDCRALSSDSGRKLEEYVAAIEEEGLKVAFHVYGEGTVERVDGVETVTQYKITEFGVAGEEASDAK